MKSARLGLMLAAALGSMGSTVAIADALGNIGGGNPLRSRNGRAPGAGMANKRQAIKRRNKARAKR